MTRRVSHRSSVHVDAEEWMCLGSQAAIARFYGLGAVFVVRVEGLVGSEEGWYNAVVMDAEVAEKLRR